MEKTKKEYYNAVIAMVDSAIETDPDVTYGEDVSLSAMREFLLHEVDLLVKKNSARSDKPTKVQVENAGYMQDILYGLEPGKSYTITEIQKTVEAVKELSNQRVSRLARNLVDSGGLVRTEVKGKAYFTLAQ